MVMCIVFYRQKCKKHISRDFNGQPMVNQPIYLSDFQPKYGTRLNIFCSCLVNIADKDRSPIKIRWIVPWITDKDSVVSKSYYCGVPCILYGRGWGH